MRSLITPSNAYKHTANLEDLELQTSDDKTKCETKKPNLIIDILWNPFPKHINSYIRDDLDMKIHHAKQVYSYLV